MAATTLAAILTRFETVLEAAPLSLSKSVQPFNDDTAPNAAVNTLFRVTSGGLIGQRPQSNYSEARMERLVVTLEQQMAFDGYAAARDLADLADDVVRAIIADGADHGYDATEEKGSRKQTNPKKTDLVRLDIGFMVDFDWSEV